MNAACFARFSALCSGCGRMAIFLAWMGLWVAPAGVAIADGASPAGGIYAADPSHLWNRIHEAFFARPDGESDTPDSDVVDPLLWPDTSSFLKTGPSHAAALGVLDEFLANDGHALIADPLKRAVLQHDLWSIFDWSARAGSDPLRSRLAAAIGHLALSPEQIAALPDNLTGTVEAGTFRAVYDPAHPLRPFLPSTLLDAESPWVCVRGAISGPSAPVHVQYYQGRSPFLVFLRLPGGRKATLKYLDDLNRVTREGSRHEAGDLPPFPVGTTTALLRQMAVIDDAGRIRTTPITQTLQMRVYRQVGTEVTDHENSQAALKFRMQRRGLFAEGHGGLKAIDWSEPLRVSLLHRADPYRHNPGAGGIKTTMQSCIACHSCGGSGTVHSIFTYKQDDWVPGARLVAPNRLRLVATRPADESMKAVNWKQTRYEWGLLQGLLKSFPLHP
jgi:hypothetical protein